MSNSVRLRSLLRYLFWLFVWIERSILPLYGQDTAMVQRARREGVVVVYSTLNEALMKPIMQRFQRMYQIEGRFFRGNRNVITDQALSEYRGGKVESDVVMGATDMMNLMKVEGLFAAYVSPASIDYPEKLIDPFFGPKYRVTPTGLAFHTGKIKPEEVPKSYDDLLHPRWKGRIVTPDPRADIRMTGWFASLHLIMGSTEQADLWTKRLAAQAPVFVSSVNPAGFKVASGEVPLGILDLVEVYIHRQKRRAPIDYVRGLPGYIGDGHYLAVSSKSAHPNAAKVFIDFFLGGEGVKIIEGLGHFVSRNGATQPFAGADEILKNFFEAQPLTPEQLNHKRNEFRQIFKQ